jgi:hypothetical protein
VPTKLTSIVSSSLNGGPGSPAQANTAATGASTWLTTASMAAGSRRST